MVVLYRFVISEIGSEMFVSAIQILSYKISLKTEHTFGSFETNKLTLLSQNKDCKIFILGHIQNNYQQPRRLVQFSIIVNAIES